MIYKSNFAYVTATDDGDQLLVRMPDGTTMAIPSQIFKSLFTKMPE